MSWTMPATSNGTAEGLPHGSSVRPRREARWWAKPRKKDWAPGAAASSWGWKTPKQRSAAAVRWSRASGPGLEEQRPLRLDVVVASARDRERELSL